MPRLLCLALFSLLLLLLSLLLLLYCVVLSRQVYLKLEFSQFTGSFKERGARNALMCLSPVREGGRQPTLDF